MSDFENRLEAIDSEIKKSGLKGDRLKNYAEILIRDAFMPDFSAAAFSMMPESHYYELGSENFELLCLIEMDLEEIWWQRVGNSLVNGALKDYQAMELEGNETRH